MQVRHLGAVRRSRKQPIQAGIILLADYGFNTYSTLIETRTSLPTRSRTWFSASSTPRSSAGTLPVRGQRGRQRNDQEAQSGNDDELLAYSWPGEGLWNCRFRRHAARRYRRHERRTGRKLFDKMVRAGVVRRDIDFRKSYTLRFTNKGVGLDLRPKTSTDSDRSVSRLLPMLRDARVARSSA